MPPGEEPTLELARPEEHEVEGTNLADLILEQIEAHEAGLDGQAGFDDDDPGDDLIPPKVVEVYTKFVQVHL